MQLDASAGSRAQRYAAAPDDEALVEAAGEQAANCPGRQAIEQTLRGTGARPGDEVARLRSRPEGERDADEPRRA